MPVGLRAYATHGVYYCIYEYTVLCGALSDRCVFGERGAINRAHSLRKAGAQRD